MRIILIPVFVLISLTFPFFIAGCESTAENNANVLVKTLRTSYHVDDTIYVDVTSLSGSPLYYICKGQIRLQLMDGNGVSKSWDIHGFDSCRRKLPIFLGETASFVVLPEETKSASSDPAFLSGGEYRFQIDLYEDADCTILLEEESDRLSNRIMITR